VRRDPVHIRKAGPAVPNGFENGAKILEFYVENPKH
jgi:hypothetical protein